MCMFSSFHLDSDIFEGTWESVCKFPERVKKSYFSFKRNHETYVVGTALLAKWLSCVTDVDNGKHNGNFATMQYV